MIVNVEEAVLDPAEIVAGLKAHVIPATDEQERLICPLKPPAALALIVRFVDPPAVSVALWVERLNEKSGPVAAAAETRLANTVVVLPPAGKLG